MEVDLAVSCYYLDVVCIMKVCVSRQRRHLAARLIAMHGSKSKTTLRQKVAGLS